VVFRRFEARGRDYVPLTLALSEDWTYGRWLLGSAALYAISTSAQTFFAAGAIGLTAAGVLRAMQVPSLAMTQTIAAMGLLVLPALSFNFGKGQFGRLRNGAILVSAALGAAAVLFAILLAFSDSGIERILYGGKYSEYVSLIPILALIPVANGLCTGYSMALRASQKPHFDLIANAVAAPVAIISTIVLVDKWALLGAAISMVLSFVAMNLVTLVLFAFCNDIRKENTAPAALLQISNRLERTRNA
jgi:O-antigen/teichoic acid export membrane protein